MPEIDFEPVALYVCPGCKRRTCYRPCPVCKARAWQEEQEERRRDPVTWKRTIRRQ